MQTYSAVQCLSLFDLGKQSMTSNAENISCFTCLCIIGMHAASHLFSVFTPCSVNGRGCSMKLNLVLVLC